MGISFIIAGIIIIIGICISLAEKDGSPIVIAIVIAVLAFGMTSLISVSTYEDCGGKKEFYEVESTEIYSIGLHDVTQGSFTLGCGSVSTKFVYTYYEKDENGNYKLNYVYCDQTTIKETNDMVPCVKKYVSKCTVSNYMWSYGTCQLYGETKYIIYVPEGSVVQQFNISA